MSRWLTTSGDEVQVFKRLRWHYRVVNTGNRKVVERGTQGYSRKIDALTAAERHHPGREATLW